MFDFRIKWVLVAISFVVAFAFAIGVYGRYSLSLADYSARFSSGYHVTVELPVARPYENLAADPVVSPAPETAEAGGAEINDGSTAVRPAGAPSPGFSAGSVITNAAPAEPDKSGVIPVRYNLTRAGDSDGAISVSKPLIVNGKNAGAIAVKIIGGATILVSRSEFIGLMQAQNITMTGRRALPNVEHISFAQLRDRGFEVRYDPVVDAISVKPQS